MAVSPAPGRKQAYRNPKYATLLFSDVIAMQHNTTPEKHTEDDEISKDTNIHSEVEDELEKIV